MNIIKTGDRFGHLVVIKDSGMRKQRHVVYECICDCGNTHYVKSIHLTQGRVKSCGCQTHVKGKPFQQNKPVIRKTVLNSIGLTINRLTIVNFKKEIRKPLRVILQCSCGNIVERDYKEFKKGKIKSCGCLSKEISANAIIKREQKQKERLTPKPKPPTPNFNPKADYSGQIFGTLLVLYWCGALLRGNHKIAIWYCQCSCGKFVVKSDESFKLPNISCGCTLYEWRKNNAIKTAKGNVNKIISFLKDEWHPREDIDHKNRRFRTTIKNLLLKKQPNGCVICGYMGDDVNQLCAHLYKPHSLFPKLRYLLSNLVILCRNCHDELHKTLGYNCTSIPEQIDYIDRMRQNKTITATFVA